MTLQPLASGFPYTVYEENFVFFFISVPGKISVENTSIRNETKGTHNIHQSIESVI